MNSALLVVDAEGRIVFANPTAEKILGAEAGGLRGRALWDWFPDTPRAALLFDPQTAGGFVAAIAPEDAEALLRELSEAGEEARIIGRLVSSDTARLKVN